jgi:ornithine cyclodeaminase
MIGVIGPDQLRTAVTWHDAVDAVGQALINLGSGRVIQPPAVEILMPDSGELHVKGGHILDSDWIVVKVATGGFPGGPPTGCLLLVDATTGAPRWLLDDRGWLTQQRTAAAGTLATTTFGRRDATTVLVIGTGGLTAALVEAHRQVAPHLDISLWGRDPDRTRALAAELGVTASMDLERAVSAADIIVTATSSRAPLIEAHWVQPGTHITALGADTVGKQELPVTLLGRANLIVCDNIATAVKAGELQHATPAIQARAIGWPDLAAGGPPTRTAEAITVADLCGIGAEDAAIAAAALRSVDLS